MVQVTRPIAIPRKRKYQPTEFVGRQDELRAVDQRVAQGKKGESIDYPVLNYWGIEGSGKSWLMRHLADRYRGPGQVGPGECKYTFTALLDLGSVDPFEWTPANVASILKPAARDILAQVKGRVSDQTLARGEAFLTQVDTAIAEQEDAVSLVRSFAAWVISLTDKFVPLILLDTIEKATPEALSKIELHLLEPLASTDHVILVTAGRREVARWRRFAVRRRQDDPIELPSFTEQDTIQQLDKQGFSWPGDLIYPYSFGLPYASQTLAVAVSELSNGHRVDKEFLEKNRRYVGKWLGALADHLLEAVPTELESPLRDLSVLRIIFRGALPYLLPDELSGDMTYRSLLGDLESTRMVWWAPDRGVYLMDPSLRRILNLNLRFEHYDTFKQRHQEAFNYYRQAILTNPYDCGVLLIEALYHASYGYPDQAREKTDELFKQTLKPDNFTVSGAEFLLTRLEEDEELREALSDDLVDQVVKSVRALHHNVREMRLSAN